MAQIGTNIQAAAKILRNCGLVGIPTETVYGLAANALDTEAVLKIFKAKNRPSFDPLIVHISSLDRLGDFARDVPEQAIRLAEEFWPGPLTLLLPKKDIVPDLVTSGLDTVAVRMPAHPLTLELLQLLGFPLAAPSANPFGYISPTTANHVNDQLGDAVDYILDGGECGIGLESTIIGFPDGEPTVFRLGGLAIEAIETIVGAVKLMPHSSSNPQAPGMLKSHYAPSRPVTLFSDDGLDKLADSAAFLMFSKLYPGIAPERQRVLSVDGSLNEAAKNLFGFLRELDQMPVARIFAELVPEEGLGRAINDRLRRAAAL